MVYWIVDGKEMGPEEYYALENQRKAQREAERIARWEADQKVRADAAQLVRQLGQAYTAYKEFVERHPQLSLRVTEGQAADHRVYEQLRENLGHADQAPRCLHIKADGRRCGSPRLKTGRLCYPHQRMAEARPRKMPLPPMEDANGVQLGIMEVSRALIDGQITEKAAGLLFYGLQTAASNVDRLTFHEAPAEMVVDEPADSAQESGRPEERPQDAFPYATIDEDLKLKLQEIGDEFDRRLRERNSLTTKDTKEHKGEPESERATDLGCELTRMSTNQGNLTTEHTEEHGGEAEAAPIAGVEGKNEQVETSAQEARLIRRSAGI